jgi:hypothetical protein
LQSRESTAFSPAYLLKAQQASAVVLPVTTIIGLVVVFAAVLGGSRTSWW